jgi:hypothetical protein
VFHDSLTEPHKILDLVSQPYIRVLDNDLPGILDVWRDYGFIAVPCVAIQNCEMPLAWSWIDGRVLLFRRDAGIKPVSAEGESQNSEKRRDKTNGPQPARAGPPQAAPGLAQAGERPKGAA